MSKPNVRAGRMIAALFATLMASCTQGKGGVDDFTINCQQLPRADFDERVRAETAQGVSRHLEDTRATKIRFNVDNSSAQEVMISIYSDRSGPVPLYHGKFSSTVEVFPKNEFFQGKGLDNFHFKFFDLRNLRVCSQVQDGGASYWQQGKDVRIEFLAEKDVDPDIGTPIGHRVHLE